MMTMEMKIHREQGAGILSSLMAVEVVVVVVDMEGVGALIVEEEIAVEVLRVGTREMAVVTETQGLMRRIFLLALSLSSMIHLFQRITSRSIVELCLSVVSRRLPFLHPYDFKADESVVEIGVTPRRTFESCSSSTDEFKPAS